MIDSMEKLYDFVNRFGLEGRRSDRIGGRNTIISGRFSVSKNRPTVFHAGLRVDTLDGWMDGWEVSTSEGWLPLAEFDDERTAAFIERLEAVHNYKHSVESYRQAVKRLKSDNERLDDRDRKVFFVPDLPPVQGPTDEYRDSIKPDVRDA